MMFYIAVCGGTLIALNGSITSPSYPDNYPKNKRCLWKIIGPKGQRISLKFEKFHLEGDVNGVSLYIFSAKSSKFGLESMTEKRMTLINDKGMPLSTQIF